MTLPEAWTPLSVRAHRTKEDFLGSEALALEIAPAATRAGKSSPSIVLCSALLQKIHISLLQLNAQEANLQLHPMIPSPRIPKQHSSLLLRPPLLILNILLREIGRIDRGIDFLALLNLLPLPCINLVIPRSLV